MEQGLGIGDGLGLPHVGEAAGSAEVAGARGEELWFKWLSADVQGDTVLEAAAIARTSVTSLLNADHCCALVSRPGTDTVEFVHWVGRLGNKRVGRKVKLDSAVSSTLFR